MSHIDNRNDDSKNEDYHPEDQALLKLARTQISDRRPRARVGEVFSWVEGNVIVVRANETLDKVIRKLTSENILSVPVISDSVACSYIGVVDIMDIVTYVCEELFSGPETTVAFTDFFAKSESFREKQVHEVMKHARMKRNLGNNSSPIDIYHTLGPGYSLLHAFEVLSQTGCQRIPVVNSGNRVVGLYTASMALSDLRQSLHTFGPNLSEKRVSECAQSDVVFSVKEDMLTINAFKKLVELGISGAPIVGPDNVLIGTLSIRELRGIGTSAEHLSRLYWTVSEFKDQARRENPQLATSSHWSTSVVPRSARYVTPSDTFADLVRATSDGCLHRVFVCSEESVAQNAPQVIAVISLTDLIRTVVQTLGTLNINSF